jgi:uncharacterized protein
MSLTTYRKNGTAMPTAVWVVDLGEGKVGFYTSSTSGKVKRIRNNPRVVVQPSNARGKVLSGSTPVEATAELVTGDRLEEIRAKVVAKYGFMTKLTRFLSKVGGFVKRKEQPYADQGVELTLSA